MTVVAEERDLAGRFCYTVNGCVTARVDPLEIRLLSLHPHDEFRELLARRLAPLIWLAMPCHEADSRGS